jgi:hypothetical protein
LIEEWPDLSKKELDEKLFKIKREAYEYEIAHKDKDTKYA